MLRRPMASIPARTHRTRASVSPTISRSAEIALPTGGSTFLQGYAVALAGGGFDLEEGRLGDDCLTWRSDRDGVGAMARS